MGYSYFKRRHELDLMKIRNDWTVWTQEGINNNYTYVYENGDPFEAKGWQCVTVICKPGLEIDYQWWGFNTFALNDVLSQINDTRLKLDDCIKQEKRIAEERKKREEETKKREEKERLAKQDKYTSFCTWNYGTKIVDIYRHEDKHFNVAVDKIMEAVKLAVEVNCGNIPAVMDILKNMNFELGRSKTDTQKTKHIYNKEEDGDGNLVYFISEYMLDWKRKATNGGFFACEVKDVSVDLKLLIFSPKNEKAKEECERLLNKCIKGGIITEVVEEYDSINVGK